MADVRNIKFEVPPAAAFQIEYNPKNAPFRFNKSGNVQSLYTGQLTFQRLGYLFEIDLIWTKNFGFDETQYEQLKTLFLEESEFYIYPNPSAEPTLKFLVNWANEFDFESSSGWVDGFQYFGEINLVGAEVLSKSDIVALGAWEFYQYA